MSYPRRLCKVSEVIFDLEQQVPSELCPFYSSVEDKISKAGKKYKEFSIRHNGKYAVRYVYVMTIKGEQWLDLDILWQQAKNIVEKGNPRWNDIDLADCVRYYAKLD